jgi:RimJ/RimL family protein N-acetyltransferase
MIKNWLRRRLADSLHDPEDETDDDDRQHGSLVRKGKLVSLRAHVPANREAFQRWYADQEIAELLRHDLEPLTLPQSRSYFDTFILPASARGTCFAIHERKTKRLIGTTALTDRTSSRNGDSALFRIVIGEKECWGKGYGTEATRLVVEEAFEAQGLDEVRLEVFAHNARAIGAYTRVGFEVTGEHVEWVPRRKVELRVTEMRLRRDAYTERGPRATRDRTKTEKPSKAERRAKRRMDEGGKVAGWRGVREEETASR